MLQCRMTIGRDVGDGGGGEVTTRHVPGSQAPFSLNPDPYQSRVDASVISVVANCVDIPLSHPTKHCPLPPQNFDKNVKDPATTLEPWTQDPKGFLHVFFQWVQIIP